MKATRLHLDDRGLVESRSGGLLCGAKRWGAEGLEVQRAVARGGGVRYDDAVAPRLELGEPLSRLRERGEVQGLACEALLGDPAMRRSGVQERERQRSQEDEGAPRAAGSAGPRPSRCCGGPGSASGSLPHCEHSHDLDWLRGANPISRPRTCQSPPPLTRIPGPQPAGNPKRPARLSVTHAGATFSPSRRQSAVHSCRDGGETGSTGALKPGLHAEVPATPR